MNFLIASLLLASANAGVIVDASLETPTSLGVFHTGDQLQISVTGMVDLATEPGVNLRFNPDGSLNNPSPLDCSACWIGYQYMLEGAAYPTVAGGDGINHFPGGGANYDLNSDSHSPWAAQGPETTDTTDPLAVRFGALAVSFDLLNWQSIGYGGTLDAPFDGTLWGVVVDAQGARYNDTGEYAVAVSTNVSEPGGMMLVATGLLLAVGVRRRRGGIA